MRHGWLEFRESSGDGDKRTNLWPVFEGERTVIDDIWGEKVVRNGEWRWFYRNSENERNTFVCVCIGGVHFECQEGI